MRLVYLAESLKPPANSEPVSGDDLESEPGRKKDIVKKLLGI